MGGGISKMAKQELVATIRDRYQQAGIPSLPTVYLPMPKKRRPRKPSNMFRVKGAPRWVAVTIRLAKKTQYVPAAG